MIDGRGKYGALPYQEDLSKIHPGTIDSKQDTEQLNSEHETVFQNSKIEVTNILHFFINIWTSRRVYIFTTISYHP